jgi:hypothetical protein
MKSKHLLAALLTNNQRLFQPKQIMFCVQNLSYSLSSKHLSTPDQPNDSLDVKKPNNLLISRYDQFVQSKQLRYDKHQFDAAVKLNTFYNKIMEAGPDQFNQTPNGVEKIFQSFLKLVKKESDEKKKEKIIKSIYLYGGVGEFDLRTLIKSTFKNAYL